MTEKPYMVVVRHIPYDEPITRRELKARTGLRDRKIRRLIEDARTDGTFIVNLSNGKGYFRTLDLDLLEVFYRQERARAMSKLVSLKPMRQWLKLNGRLTNG